MTQADYDTRIRGLQDKLAALQRARVRYEHEADQARVAAATARAQLLAEFGVDTVEGAHAMLVTLENDLQARIDALAALLTELEA